MYRYIYLFIAHDTNRGSQTRGICTEAVAQLRAVLARHLPAPPTLEQPRLQSD